MMRSSITGFLIQWGGAHSSSMPPKNLNSYASMPVHTKENKYNCHNNDFFFLKKKMERHALNGVLNQQPYSSRIEISCY
jgi:hypothetical protein